MWKPIYSFFDPKRSYSRHVSSHTLADRCVFEALMADMNFRGQMESNEIDHVDPGVDWWTETFASSSTDNVPDVEHPDATVATTSKPAPYTRSLRYLYQASLSIGSSDKHPNEALTNLPAVQLSAHQWSLAYLCESTGMDS